jgi:YVTN family beta-propeller protein
VTRESGFITQYDVVAGGALALKSPDPVVLAGGFPIGIAVNPDGASVYVANRDSSNLSQYDVGAGGALTPKGTATVGTGLGPSGIAVRPTTIADLIASVEALDLPHGIENSLLKKLTGAQKKLDAGHLHGACGKLGAFVNQVRAQSGKKIDADDADELIAEATAVRESLGCGAGKKQGGSTRAVHSPRSSHGARLVSAPGRGVSRP